MKKLLSMLIILAMVLTPIVSFAEAGITKEETVYVITKSDGKPDDVIVSDHLINNSKYKSIEDKSDLNYIENVKGEEKFRKKGNNLTWEASGNDIYYQGKTNKEIPVNMNVSYAMNGEKFSGEKMQGKKGDFKINIDFSTSNGIPFVILTGILVHDENYSGIKINNGKVIDDGEKTIVAGIAAPGILDEYNTVTITGHTTSFDVTDIMTLATNSIFDDIDFDMFGNLNFDDQIRQLDKGSKQLVDGSRKLYRGLLKLNNAAPKLADGIGQLNTGASTLASGTLQLKAGVTQLYPGAVQLHDGIVSMQSGVNAMNLESKISEMTSGLNQLSAGITKMTAASDTVLSSADAAIEIASSIINSLSEKIGTENTQTLLYALNGASQYIQGAKAINNSTTSPQLPTGGINQTVSGAVQQINAGLSGVSISALTSGLSQLESGSQSLANGLGQMSGSIGDETDEKTLVGGAAALAKGMEQLNSQTGTLLSGIQDLTDGSGKLADGMEQLYDEGIKKIVDLYNGDLKNIVNEIESLVNSGKSYNNFSEIGPGMTGSVKFIFKTAVE